MTNIDLEPDEDMSEYDLAPWFTPKACQIFHVALDNGREVELVGHEFELVSCTHDKDL